MKSSAVAVRVVALVRARLNAISKMHKLIIRFDVFMIVMDSVGVLSRVGGVQSCDVDLPLVWGTR